MRCLAPNSVKEIILHLSSYFFVTSLSLRDNILDGLRVELKREAFLSCDNYNFWDETNATKEKHYAIKNLLSNKEILTQKN